MKVGFIGAGRMATALCRGFIYSSFVQPSDIICSDVNRTNLRKIRELGVRTTLNNRELVEQNEVIYLATKPHSIPGVIQEIQDLITPRNLIVSVAAGITIKSIEKALPPDSRVVRVMPNTPALVQSAASVFALGKAADDEDANLVIEMLSCVGLVEEMQEKHMDAVTGLSGNGPSYGFVMIQALSDGGVKMGINRAQSTRLAAQSLLGAAKMVLDTKSHPEALKDEVMSAGGTSAHALHQMEKAGFRGAVIDAVEAGTMRSQNIGAQFAFNDDGKHHQIDNSGSDKGCDDEVEENSLH